MVTLETSKDIFFGLEDCDLCNFIELVTKFLPLPPRIIRMKKPNKEILNYINCGQKISWEDIDGDV